MESVRLWAAGQGFAYRFFDDRFFDFVPDDLRERASVHKCILADYARLVAAQQLLAEGWDRVVWLDADALVFAPESFVLSIDSGYAFCREVWLDRITLGQPQFRLTVNNSISIFCRDEAIIDFYLDAAQAILRSQDPLNALSIGTDFLLRLRRARQFPLVTSMGIFGPEMAYRYLQNDGRFLRQYLSYQTSPIYAANLCLSHQSDGQNATAAVKRLIWDEAEMLAFIRRLQSDGGRSLNAWFEPAYSPSSSEFDRPLSRYLGVKYALKSLLSVARS